MEHARDQEIDHDRAACHVEHARDQEIDHGSGEDLRFSDAGVHFANALARLASAMEVERHGSVAVGRHSNAVGPHGSVAVGRHGNATVVRHSNAAAVGHRASSRRSCRSHGLDVEEGRTYHNQEFAVVRPMDHARSCNSSGGHLRCNIHHTEDRARNFLEAVKSVPLVLMEAAPSIFRVRFRRFQTDNRFDAVVLR